MITIILDWIFKPRLNISFYPPFIFNYDYDMISGKCYARKLIENDKIGYWMMIDIFSN